MKTESILKNIFIILFIAVIGSFNFAFAQFGASNNIVLLKTYLSLNKITAGSEFKLAAKLSIQNGWHINSDKPNDETLIATQLTVDTSEGFKLKSISYPKAEDLKFSFSETPLSVWEGEIYIGALLDVSPNLKPGVYPLVVSLLYQSCNNVSCLPPKTIKDTINIEVVDKSAAVSEINREIFNSININYSLAADANNGSNDSVLSTLEHSGLLLSLLFVFLGGLALNLTPCVYPLIPITIGYFGGQTEGSTKRLFFMGLFFVIGMAVTYSVIGVITALSGAVFGSLLQSPFVIILIALIFIALSLSMFGLYEFSLPNSIVAKAGGSKSGYFGALFMGLTMGIVAAPCIGPFVLGLVTYVAAKADPYYGFLMFFFLALGLGFPYLLLAVFSGKIKKLPRAGEWMESVKHIFGLILLGMALYFILPLLPKNISGYVLPSFMIIAALYILFFDKYANKLTGFRIFKIVFSILLIAASVYTLIPSEKKSIDWKQYDSSVEAANISNGKGMIIDFYADWCIPCKELDAKTFSDAKVIEAAKNFHTYKANMTKSLSPDVETLRDKYNIIGVPTVLITNSRGEEVKRITGFVDANEFLKILKEVD